MKLFLIVAIAALMSIGLNAADLAGTWKGSMETQMGKSDVTVLIKPGTELTGTVDFGQFQGRIENAKLVGDKVSFEVNIEPGKVGFVGTVSGNEMKFTVIGTRGDEYPLTCRRQ